MTFTEALVVGAVVLALLWIVSRGTDWFVWRGTIAER